MSTMVRLGRAAGGSDVLLDPLAVAHTLFTGRTRSGKSVQVYGALAQLKGLPVQVCGIDPTGILFNALGEDLGGSTWRVSTLRDPERARDVMGAIVEEMDRRIIELLQQRRDKFTRFTTEFPALIVLLEEYPGTLAALQALDQASGAKVVDRVETRIRAAIQRLALEGAKVGVFLWIVAQRADASLLTGVLRSQLTQRFSFSQDADGLRMLHEAITPEQIEAAQTFLPGQAFAEIAGSLPVTQYRADLIDYPELVEIFTDKATMPRTRGDTGGNPTQSRSSPSARIATEPINASFGRASTRSGLRQGKVKADKKTRTPVTP